jgi:hypothetical protein
LKIRSDHREAAANLRQLACNHRPDVRRESGALSIGRRSAEDCADPYLVGAKAPFLIFDKTLDHRRSEVCGGPILMLLLGRIKINGAASSARRQIMEEMPALT